MWSSHDRVQSRAPPEVVLSAELDVGAHDSHLDRDQHGQHAHHKAEAKDVVEVPLQTQRHTSEEIGHRGHYKRQFTCHQNAFKRQDLTNS